METWCSLWASVEVLTPEIKEDEELVKVADKDVLVEVVELLLTELEVVDEDVFDVEGGKTLELELFVVDEDVFVVEVGETLLLVELEVVDEDVFVVEVDEAMLVELEVVVDETDVVVLITQVKSLESVEKVFKMTLTAW